METLKPFGINMESGKSVERDKLIFPINYNQRNVDIGRIMKEESVSCSEKVYYGADKTAKQTVLVKQFKSMMTEKQFYV